MKSFRLVNIKSFKDTDEIELKPITIFVGPNSSGKSSLLRFPVVISQTYLEETISPIIFNGKYVDYGNFEDVVHNHSGDRLSFSLTFDLKEFQRTARFPVRYPRINYSLKFFQKYKKIDVTVVIRKIENKIVVHEYQIKVDSCKVFSLKKENSKFTVNLYYYFTEEEMVPLDSPISFLLSGVVFEKFVSVIDFPYSINREELIKIFEKIAKQKFNFNQQENFDVSEILDKTILDNRPAGLKNNNKSDLSSRDQEIVDYFNLIINTLFSIDAISNGLNSYTRNFGQRVNYIGPFRATPERTYRQSESLHNYVGKSGEYSSMLLRQAEKNQHPLFEKVSSWFTKAMGYQIGIEEIAGSNLFRIKVYSEQKPDGDNLIDVGFGISQILPIVTQLYYDKQQENEYRRIIGGRYSSEIFVIEQPEIHLHPKAQADLANLFVERVLDKQNKSQIIIETHSEHLIRRLQSLVADPDNRFSSNDVAIYYVDMNDIGNSVVKKMELTPQGQFKEKWPSGFFDKGYLLSQELIRNASKKVAQ